MNLYLIEVSSSGRQFHVVAESAEASVEVWRNNWPHDSCYRSGYITKIELVHSNLILPAKDPA